MTTLIDDVGSFPLPSDVKPEVFSKAYVSARKAIIKGESLNDSFLKSNFSEVVLSSFKKKLFSGLDVVTYPQQYDGIKQVGDAIHKAMENGTFVVDEKDAFLPEVQVISSEAKRLSEEFGRKILLRVSLFGPMEQYLKEVGTVGYSDVLDEFAQTIKRFAKNSILDSKYIKTEVISLDEPSFGFLNIATESDVLCNVLEKAFDFSGSIRQIHLHSASRLPDLFCVKNIDVLSFEYAASPKNIEGISKSMLESADKKVRVGVSRTDIGSIFSELNDRGISNPVNEQIVESPATIKKRYIYSKRKFGETMLFTGPDCGVGSWPSQDAAQLLLSKTVEAVRDAQKELGENMK